MQEKTKLIVFILFASVVTAIVTVFYRYNMNGSIFTGTSTNFLVEEEARFSRGSDVVSAPAMQGMMMDSKVLPVEPGYGQYPILPPGYYGDDALDVDDRVYEQSAHHSVVVADVSGYLRSMKEYFLSIDGRVLSTNLQSGEKYNSGYLYVKVPATTFSEATGRVTEGVVKVYSEHINAQDVTGEVVSVSEQLSKLEEQKTLKEIELVEVQTAVEKKRIELELQRIQSQIEAVTKRQDVVDQRVSYANISITAADSVRYFDPNAPLDLWSQFLEAVTSLKDVLRVVSVVAVWAAVYAVFWVPVVVLFKKFGSGIKKN